MRKIPSSMWEKNERSVAMAQQMEKDLQQSLEFVEYKPLNSSFVRDNDSDFDSFGVFAKTNLEFGHVVPGVLGYLAHLPKEEVVEKVNDFSVVWHKKASQIMLGPLSFVNSSCVPNSAFVPDVKRKIMELSVISKKGVKAGKEVTVFYGGIILAKTVFLASVLIQNITVQLYVCMISGLGLEKSAKPLLCRPLQIHLPALNVIFR